jgi:hypothetical protein
MKLSKKINSYFPDDKEISKLAQKLNYEKIQT